MSIEPMFPVKVSEDNNLPDDHVAFYFDVDGYEVVVFGDFSGASKLCEPSKAFKVGVASNIFPQVQLIAARLNERDGEIRYGQA